MIVDSNRFKVAIKNWIRENPEGTLNDLVDFCEAQIPVSQYASHQWLIDHTISWYKHILVHRETSRGSKELAHLDDESDVD